MFYCIEASTPTHYTQAATLFREYAAQLDTDLAYQGFTEELATLSQQYAPPTGALLLITQADDEPVGCLGLRAWDTTVCELKRMYLRPQARGQGIGKDMLNKALAIAKHLGYTKMRLDTLPAMTQAISLYRRLGFYEIEPYRFSPIAGTIFFEIRL